MVVDEDLELEKKEIVRRYRRLLRHSKPFLKKGDTKEIKRAFTTSMEAHADMRRKSGEPYIFHPLEVAQICVDEIGLGTTSIVCALLHDVVEDTEISIPEVEADFGKKVAKIIDGLTKISGVFEQGSSQQAENFRKMLLTLSDDVRVILIKLADRLHNMRTLESMPRHKQLKIANETIYLYAPLAHRLGLYNIKSELEDLSLKFTDMNAYKEISEKIKFSKDIRDRFIRQFIRPIKEEIVNLGYIFDIKGRPKSIYSIWNKMRHQDVSFEEVYDLFAIRIIVDTDIEKEKAACWQIYSVVTDFYQPNPDRLRDWVSTPRANGYESLHTTVMSSKGQWVEVQIRTNRMDDIAERGYAAHWKYKDSKRVSDADMGLEMWIGKVREILEQDKSSAIEFVDDFRSNFFQDEVFVFTPKGDLTTLPGGATALDFAFDIHSEVGYHCLGAKVNQKLVPLNHKLRNGDQVEILNSKKQKPNEGWLEYVVTSKAKAKIKDALKEERKEVEDAGKEIIQRKLGQLKKRLTSDELNGLASHFKLQTVSELYFNVGTGKIEHKQIKQFYKQVLDEKSLIQKRPSHSTEAHDNLRKTTKNDHDLLLLGEDMDVLDYKFAACCNPIPGDDVFGFVTVSEGIKVHRTTCSNAAELLSHYGYRIIKAKWTSRQDKSFEVGVKLLGTDRIGLINDISNVISGELKVNMRSITINTEGGIFEGEIHLYINHTRHLDTLIEKLEVVQGVVNISRIF
ncbi:MAG: bifunctional (p)ppGpp synthetase/guanosine-3',5'-bis(diphosphate) 3'-pyrophosphohydrolase [Cytophagales bacterium]|nr:bifunctional (p)ppGpp synthetase/guanosine-3',5'-bis(diphosphate) 3'-pyrophosphohydrolase [Cytophagales bacterium]